MSKHKPHKPGDLFCAAHQRFLTEEDLENRNCIKQPCKHLSVSIIYKSFENKVESDKMQILCEECGEVIVTFESNDFNISRKAICENCYYGEKEDRYFTRNTK